MPHLGNIKCYLISAPPRVGGNLIADIIKSAGDKNFLDTIHTHDPCHELDVYSDTALIIAKRRDIFASTISNCIVWHTQQSTIYSEQTIVPFVVDESQFLLQYAFQVWHLASHDLTRPYAMVKEFYFEDFVNNHEHVLSQLGLTSNPFRACRLNFLNKAPYNYKEIVINYQQLKILFDGLDPTQVINPYINGYKPQPLSAITRKNYYGIQ